jgi:hypothetical protein
MSLILWPLYHQEMSPRYPLNRKLSGPQGRSGFLWRREKSIYVTYELNFHIQFKLICLRTMASHRGGLVHVGFVVNRMARTGFSSSTSVFPC